MEGQSTEAMMRGIVELLGKNQRVRSWPWLRPVPVRKRKLLQNLTRIYDSYIFGIGGLRPPWQLRLIGGRRG
jgi:hypothetical protein